MVRLDRMFGDHMVLQQGKVVLVWGTADPDEIISVTIQGKTWTDTADADGQWRVKVGPLEVSFEETMVVSGTVGSVCINDVAVGEVWLAGGQSNMEFPMKNDADIADELEHCQDTAIRFFDYPEVSFVGQVDIEPYAGEYAKNYGFWRTCDRENLERYSAVGYYYAKELRNALKVPVGIIGCNWGGTKASSWMISEMLANYGGQIYLDEYAEAVKDLNINVYNERYLSDPSTFHTDLFVNPFDALPQEVMAAMMEDGIEAMFKKITELGIEIQLPSPEDPSFRLGPKSEHRPGALYESMLSQIAPYGIRGFLYYQGESDGDAHGELYSSILPGLIACWRRTWQDETLPFLLVQIAPLDAWGDCSGADYIEIRRAQQNTEELLKNTGVHLVITSDAGMQYDIHPTKKAPVGRRLALQARHYVYGEDILSDAPQISDAFVEDGSLTLSFRNSGNGLFLGNSDVYGTPVAVDALEWLTIVQNGTPVVGKRRVEVSEDTVRIYMDNIMKNKATEIQIGQSGYYVINLYNSAGIPARPECWIIPQS